MAIVSDAGKNNHDVESNLCIVPSVLGRPTQFFLTATGDGLGTYNLIGNYSAAPTDFYYQATTNYYIQTLLIIISDNANFNQTDYGARAALTNGVKIFIKPNGLAEIPLLSGIAFKQNFEWHTVTPEVRLTSFAGLAQTLSIDFDLVVDYGMPIMLSPGDRFIIRLNDDFTTLVSHTFGLRGRKM